MIVQKGKFALIFTMLLGVTATALAQPTTKPLKYRSGEYAAITSEMIQKLGSDDADARKQALEAIKERLGTTPARVLDPRLGAFKILLAGKHYDEALDLAWHGVITHANDARLLEQFQQNRVRALLAAGKTEEALQNAKSLYNVATMNGTAEAILLVAECLNAARPKDKESFNKFREEQIAGANPPAPAAAKDIRSAKGARCTVLDSIKVDPKVYDQALAGMTGEDYQSLETRGNLLLMADKVKEAGDIFERMYSLATNSDLIEASEAIARTIRAEDGTIGRANAWVGAIRPKPATAPSK